MTTDIVKTETEVTEKKPANPFIRTVVAVAATAAISCVTSVLYMQHSMQQQLSQYALRTAVPQIAVIDFDATVKSKVANGMPQVDVLRHVHLLTMAAMADGYLLLDKQYVAASSPDYDLPELTTEQLERALQAKGITPTTVETLQSTLKESQERLNAAFQ